MTIPEANRRAIAEYERAIDQLKKVLPDITNGDDYHAIQRSIGILREKISLCIYETHQFLDKQELDDKERIASFSR